jgi:hypothetical protein
VENPRYNEVAYDQQLKGEDHVRVKTDAPKSIVNVSPLPSVKLPP